MSGHNKWSKIKHQKKKQDKRKSKLFSKLVREIQVAARKDTNPETNSDLREAIERAKEANMPADNIERAIQRVKDQQEKGNLNKEALEGFGPEGTGLIIEIFTDNKNRTVSEIRHILNKNGGELADKGSTKWMFKRKVAIQIEEQEWVQSLELELIDQGLEDFKNKDGKIILLTSIENFSSLQKTLQQKNIEHKEKETVWIPKNPEAKEKTEKLNQLVQELKDNQDVEGVYLNLENQLYKF